MFLISSQDRTIKICKMMTNFRVSPSYPYEEEKRGDLDPKRNRTEDGAVKTKPRNFYTNTQTKVLGSYFKPIPYIEDPYNRAKVM